ncbi:MAG TPA: Ran-binding zinc finger domain-containing protein [Gemmatimonadaceae bacterium]|nr:Ran-binding zinc finger domain-containing protein [Gemmatimonadaceae bacterium]
MKEQPGLENVAALILERQRIENWLATLDARKASTPDHVYQRVRGDYANRLKAITDQLLARSTSLKSHVDQVNARLTQFGAEAQRLKDVRAEAELRMQVGELSVADWNVKARECDEGVARLSEAQAQARAMLAQAKEILTMVTGQAGGAMPASRSSTSSPRVSRPLNLDQIRTATPSRNGSVPPATPAAGGSAMDELAFLNSVVGGGPGVGSQPPAQEPPKQELEGAPDLAETLLKRVNQRAQGNPRPDDEAESLLKGVGTPKPGNTQNPLAANVTESNPIELKSQGGPERHKTLKCQECSTMNYPTEWYCERCGAELAAV